MKNVLITGASEGIGLEIAKKMAGLGHKITLVSRSKEKLGKAIEGLMIEGYYGEKHSYLVCDLTKTDDLEVLNKNIKENRYDILINNAGMGMYGHFDQLSLKDQLQMMNLNMNAVTTLSHSFLSQAKRNDSLVNIASVLGTSSAPGASVYSATKAFVTILSESLWGEYKKKGVYVLGFCPGVTSTNFHNLSGGDKELLPKFITQTPEQVANELVRALELREKPKVVSGLVNRAMLFFQKMMSRGQVSSFMGGFSLAKQ